MVENGRAFRAALMFLAAAAAARRMSCADDTMMPFRSFVKAPDKDCNPSAFTVRLDARRCRRQIVAAQTWPDHPIRFIVPFAAGGANDLLAAPPPKA